MAFNKNEEYSEVFGATENGHRYTQNGAHYQADGKLCKGSKMPKTKDTAKANKKLTDENADLKAQLAALQAAQAIPVQGVDVVDTDDVKADENEADNESTLAELPLSDLLETDIGNSKGKAYKTADSAAATIKSGEDLVVIRAVDGFYLRPTANSDGA